MGGSQCHSGMASSCEEVVSLTHLKNKEGTSLWVSSSALCGSRQKDEFIFQKFSLHHFLNRFGTIGRLFTAFTAV